MGLKRKLVKIGAMIAIAAMVQIGACKLAFHERGYKAMGSERLVFPVVLYLEYKLFCDPDENLFGDEENNVKYRRRKR